MTIRGHSYIHSVIICACGALASAHATSINVPVHPHAHSQRVSSNDNESDQETASRTTPRSQPAVEQLWRGRLSGESPRHAGREGRYTDICIAPEMIEFRHPGPDHRIGTNYQYRDLAGRPGVAVQLICQRSLKALPSDLIVIWRDTDKNRLIESDWWLPQCEADHAKRHEEKQDRAY